MEDDEVIDIIREVRERYGGHKTTDFGARLLEFVDAAEDAITRLHKIDGLITKYEEAGQ